MCILNSYQEMAAESSGLEAYVHLCYVEHNTAMIYFKYVASFVLTKQNS